MRPLTVLFLAILVCWSCSESTSPSTSNSGESSSPLVATEPQGVDQAIALAALPTYPGAKADRSGFVLAPVQDGQRRMAATLTAPDEPGNVAKFYGDALKVEPLKEGEKIQVVGKTSNGSDVILFFEPGKPGAKITVRAILYVRE